MKKCLLMGILAVLTLGVVACANEDETTEEKMMNSLSVFEETTQHHQPDHLGQHNGSCHRHYGTYCCAISYERI